MIIKEFLKTRPHLTEDDVEWHKTQEDKTGRVYALVKLFSLHAPICMNLKINER